MATIFGRQQPYLLYCQWADWDVVLVHHQLLHEQPPGRRHKLSEHCSPNYHNPGKKSLLALLQDLRKAPLHRNRSATQRGDVKCADERAFYWLGKVNISPFQAETSLSLLPFPLSTPIPLSACFIRVFLIQPGKLQSLAAKVSELTFLKPSALGYLAAPHEWIKPNLLGLAVRVLL